LKGLEFEPALPQMATGDLGNRWIDWIIAHALLKEAKALIKGPGAPVADESVPK
jgi:hypothetical protein